jgi:hypothetical protein
VLECLTLFFHMWIIYWNCFSVRCKIFIDESGKGCKWIANQELAEG